MAIRSPSITLSNGVEMPQMGLGTWVTTPAEMKAALKIAIETGYRLLDTASLYKNEGAIGETIQELIKSGAIKREDLFIITKQDLAQNPSICHNFTSFQNCNEAFA
ncbi:hypothetical protein RB195_021814 [Necator americanus]|uniref:NADP-dependent oxidoreductase domain-containing protein n=1 Tax=Necator americanus TaxID=51031 RepID=A0ABR1ECR5_NECAM